MKITKLIQTFEKLLPIYKDAYKKNLSWDELWTLLIQDGLCFSAMMICDTEINGVMDTEYGYYKNYIKFKCGWSSAMYLFPKPKTGKGLKTRIDFMESEIKDLKKLIKKGFTHI